MAALTGHHWITHSLADIIVFFVLGYVFIQSGTAERMAATKTIQALVIAVVAAGLGLVGWFFFI